MRAILVCTAALLSALAGPTAAQVRRVAEMSTTSLRALDRERTAVVLVGGILEEHGPYLPAFTDGYVNERLAADLATAIAARPGWTALVFPTIPLGVGGANEIGRRFSVAGTYTVRASTLRAVFMDLADELGAQGFRWVFAVHGHGAPSHNRALDDAGDYFEATYGGRMLHLTGLLPVLEAEPPMPTAAEERENGLEIHAGAKETSALLALRPDLVPSAVRSAPTVRGDSMPDMVRLALRADWPGYFGAPRHASAELGRRRMRMRRDSLVALALRALDGAELHQIPRLGDVARGNPSNVEIDAAATREAERREATQRAWLARHRQ
ncbi:MAG TPA: creatininase family protein [Gemmatimonadaceae bacterium]|nr:creatininase family protein [Gemmatimonadaceae bacterium]